MKIKQMTICAPVSGTVLAADTSKHDYVVRVKSLLAQHDHSAQKPYIKRAEELFKSDSESESLLPILLSA
jgi:hypothetical protein